MNNSEAAKLLVEMIGLLAKSSYEDVDYNEAVSLACAALLNGKEAEGKDDGNTA